MCKHEAGEQPATNEKLEEFKRYCEKEYPQLTAEEIKAKLDEFKRYCETE